MSDEKKCEQCDLTFTPHRDWQKYCSIPCRNKAHSRWWGNSRRRADETEEEFKLRIRGYAARKGRNYIEGNAERGLCRSCAKPVVGNSISWCEYHWLQQAAFRAGLRGVEWIPKLKTLLELQNFTCPYTGVKLAIGENASLDHIQPSSRFPGLKNCLENLEWVDLHVNRAKRDLTKEEFVELCKTIAARKEWTPLPTPGLCS